MSAVLYIVIDAVFAVLALLGLALILACLAIYDWLKARVEAALVRWIMWAQNWPGYSEAAMLAKKIKDEDDCRGCTE